MKKQLLILAIISMSIITVGQSYDKILSDKLKSDNICKERGHIETTKYESKPLYNKPILEDQENFSIIITPQKIIKYRCFRCEEIITDTVISVRDTVWRKETNNMKKLKNLSKQNEININRHLQFNSNKPQLNGIACPECGAELYDSNPMVTLTSIPPQLNIHCSKCGYSGYRYK